MPNLFNLNAPYALSSSTNQGQGFLSGLIGGLQGLSRDRQAAEAIRPYLDSTYGTQPQGQTAGFLANLLGTNGTTRPAPATGGALEPLARDATVVEGADSAPPLARGYVPSSQVPTLAPGGTGPQGGTRISRAAIESLFANPDTRRLAVLLMPGGEMDYKRQQDERDWNFQERKFSADQDYRRQSLDIQRSAAARANARLEDNAPRTTTIYDPESGQPQTAQWNAKSSTWDPVGGTRQPAPRPVPSAILKAEGEDLQDVQTIGQLNDRLGGYIAQIDNGKLQLGPVQNKVAELKNWAGNSDPASQAYASFIAGMEQMRNESLRLNKGVQTEGDAQRAWNELFANVNDPAVVKKRLEEIRDYNAKAAEFKKNQIGLRRATSNLPELDTSTVLTAPAGGLPKSGESNSPREGQTATNPQTGARIIFRGGKWENM